MTDINGYLLAPHVSDLDGFVRFLLMTHVTLSQNCHKFNQ